ncbi:MAG TPA: DUF4465 domain-containing protein [Bacteroidales bacterium]|nr:DUF4465 domain-containing protein [Bacteroidales bacterium]HNZ42522.1 DUF4465 domain-containing protein [Bacteroidales bacterium]HOH83299.1 DUF4465 domain-containing protein [Bacteroidales bacterium]HPB25653.1 DUF4465 domain-containing protein [Bacteroidales bacterium]HPI29643.1 DUF4465 domain-containing protein [Bacteroidales bacterium]
MKKLFLFFSGMVFTILFLSNNRVEAQTIADFENLPLPADTFWNGSDLSGFFSSGNASFTNNFTDWGGGITSWNGFSYSNKRDTTTQSYTNEYSAITALGFDSSDKYAVCYVSAFDPLPRIRLNGIAKGDTVSGFYITNSTYGYLTMKNGGGPAKKFGGVNGSDPDWFALSVYAYKDGNKKNDSVLFYLADFRFPSPAQDYIVKDWQWVDLTSLGMVDSLEFKLFSTDTAGGFGINNPTYFCMDNLITNHNSFAGVSENIPENITVYPNPAEDWIVVNPGDTNSRIRIFDMKGNWIIPQSSGNSLVNLSGWAPGIYIVEVSNNNSVFYSKFIKK